MRISHLQSTMTAILILTLSQHLQVDCLKSPLPSSSTKTNNPRIKNIGNHHNTISTHKSILPQHTKRAHYRPNSNHYNNGHYGDSTSSHSSSILKYSNLPEEDDRSSIGSKNKKSSTNGSTIVTSNKVIDEWFGKWFEENLHKSFEQFKEHIHKNNNVHIPYFTPDFTSVDGLGSVHHKTSPNGKKGNNYDVVVTKKSMNQKILREVCEWLFSFG